jgi:hypothetical protein
MPRAAGSFDVKLSPQPAVDGVGDPAVGRMAIAKQFHGELEAASAGEMLAFRSPVAGSAGYVAMERVVGSLGGRTGTFVLQHSGTMTRGTPSLAVAVVADSGTEALAGLSGTMQIIITDGKHAYDFAYELPDAS